MQPNIDFKTLPMVVKQLSDCIGLADAFKVVEQFKGRAIYVPMKVTKQPLFEIISHDAATNLVRDYGGCRIEIPKCDQAFKMIRDKQICTSTKSQSELAREWNLTTRHIRNIIKQNKV